MWPLVVNCTIISPSNRLKTVFLLNNLEGRRESTMDRKKTKATREVQACCEPHVVVPITCPTQTFRSGSNLKTIEFVERSERAKCFLETYLALPLSHDRIKYT